MSNERTVSLSIPEAPWSTLQKIIRAYYAKRDAEIVTVEEVAQAAGISRPRVSANNNFLKAFGVLELESYKLTPIGTELAIGIGRSDGDTIRNAIRKLVDGCPPLKKLIEVLESRGELSEAALQTQAYLAFGLGEGAKEAKGIATILEVLIDGGVLAKSEAGGLSLSHSVTLRMGPAAAPAAAPPVTSPAAPSNAHQAVATGFHRIPIAVSTGAVWYIEIPESHKPEELKKFLDMQTLIFDVK
jgi:hypothetical protein